jgi:hypothetical protein
MNILAQTAVICLYLLSSVQVVAAQGAGVVRSSLFAIEANDRIEDAGVLTVADGPFARTEAFEVVRRADGGRVVTSVITGSKDSYRSEGRWEFDANEQATSAVGKTSYNGEPVDIGIVSAPPSATVTISVGDVRRFVSAPCDPDCLIDMAPSALPMFTMTRQYSRQAGGNQRFRWIAQGLTQDQTLLKGHADIRLVRTEPFNGKEVSQYLFVETITKPDTGDIVSFAFNLWVDGEHRPLAFDTVGSTLGTRDGYEAITMEMPAIFD